MEDKNGENEPRQKLWLVFRDAPFAPWFLPSSGGGGRRRRDTITKLFGCVNVIMCGHDHMTC